MAEYKDLGLCKDAKLEYIFNVWLFSKGYFA